MINNCILKGLKQQIYSVYGNHIDGDTLQDILSNFCAYLNEVIDITNEYTKKIDEVLKWIVSNGLEEAVIKQLNKWIDDGTMDSIINQQIFGDLSNKLEELKNNFEKFVIQTYLYGVIGDGETDCSMAIQKIVDNASNGSYLAFPSGKIKLDYDVDYKGKVFNVIATPTTEFIGRGNLPSFTTNQYHRMVGNTFVSKPSEGKTDHPQIPYGNYGDGALSLEMYPQEGYKGNAVGLFCSARSHNSVKESELWGANIITTVSEPYEGNVWGLEIDLNTHATKSKGIGIDVTSTGQVNGQFAYIARRANNTKWQYGFIAQKCENGMAVSDSDRGIIITRCGRGLEETLDKDHIVLKTTNETLDTDNIFILQDENANILYSLKGDGSIRGKNSVYDKMFAQHVSASEKISMPNVEGQPQETITKYLHKRLITPSQNVGANTTVDITVQFDGLKIGDFVSLNCISAPPTGLTWCAYPVDNQLKIRLANVTTQQISSGELQFECIAIKHQ